MQLIARPIGERIVERMAQLYSIYSTFLGLVLFIADEDYVTKAIFSNKPWPACFACGQIERRCGFSEEDV